MKVLLLSLLLISPSVFAYEDAATLRALESEFANLSSHSSIEYSEGAESCDLNANVIAYTSAGFSYECNVCLIADDNLLWDFDMISCESARD